MVQEDFFGLWTCLLYSEPCVALYFFLPTYPSKTYVIGGINGNLCTCGNLTYVLVGIWLMYLWEFDLCSCGNLTYVFVEIWLMFMWEFNLCIKLFVGIWRVYLWEFDLCTRGNLNYVLVGIWLMYLLKFNLCTTCGNVTYVLVGIWLLYFWEFDSMYLWEFNLCTCGNVTLYVLVEIKKKCNLFATLLQNTIFWNHWILIVYSVCIINE